VKVVPHGVEADKAARLTQLNFLHNDYYCSRHWFFDQFHTDSEGRMNLNSIVAA
jgi:hypothetical protein